MLTQLGRKTLNTIFYALEFAAPEHCFVCDERIDIKPGTKQFICSDCLSSIPLADNPDTLINRLIQNFPGDELAISRVCSLLSVTDDHAWMKLIYKFKYSGLQEIGMELGRQLAKRLKMFDMNDYDYILPVPIHNARRRERGYNQSSIIAAAIAGELNTQTSDRIVKRIKYTESQTALDKTARQYNTRNVFGPGREILLIKNKKVLLVDDVLTTGSTINHCAWFLLESGARQVDAASLVKA
jgi:ComF family protein